MNIKRNRIEAVVITLAVISVALIIGKSAINTIEICTRSDGYVEIEKHDKFTSANHFKRR